METPKETFYHNCPVQIRFNDIDILGHVNNAVIQEYFDLGRMHYLQDVFGELIFKSKEALFIASINTDFLAPVFLKGDVEVKTAIVHVGNKSLIMKQRLVEASSGEIKAACESVMVAVNKQTSESILMPGEWRKLIGKQEKRDLT